MHVSALAARTAFAAALLLVACAARAGLAPNPVILTVGSGGSCDHATIQAAIDAAPGAGSTVIRISNNVGHVDQALRIENKTIELRGGYPGCGFAAPAGARTTIRGTGGDSVVLIDAVGTPRTVILRDLVIREGGSSDVLSERGGGVRIDGLAHVEVRNTHIGDNSSHRGGGIAIDGDDASLLLDDGSIVGAVGGMAGNRAIENGPATVRGGGIDCDSATVEIIDARIRTNTSEGSGGGLYSDACIVSIAPRPAFVEGDATSGGFDGFATFFENHAEVNGGAIFAENGLIDWRSSEPAGHFGGRASGNTAGNAGGALSLRGPAMQFTAVWVRFEDSHAPNTGGAIHVVQDARFALYGVSGMRCDYHRCPAIVDSNLEPPDGQDATGGAIYADTGADIVLAQVLLSGNVAGSGSAVVAGGEGTRLTLRQSLVHRNFLTETMTLDAPISITSGADATLIHVTMAGNLRPDPDTLLAPPASSVVASGATTLVTLDNSIFAGDGLVTARTLAGATVQGSCLLSHEAASVPGTTIGEPDYIDPLGSTPDFTPGPASAALDRCAVAETPPLVPLPDFSGRTRPVNLPEATNGAGTYDMGALERPRTVMFADGFESPLMF